MSSNTNFTIRQLFDSGVHFGHRAHLWCPKMAPYIFGTRNRIHIINLEKTAHMLKDALEAVHKSVSRGGRVLFVGSKRQARDLVASAAASCGQYYVNHRWIGGLLTNWSNLFHSLESFKKLERDLSDTSLLSALKKREILHMQRKYHKMNLTLGGIRDMKKVPDIVIVFDVSWEKIAVKEASKVGVPVIGIVDTNSSPELVDYVIPGNDDSTRALALYCQLFSSAIMSGLEVFVSSKASDDKEYSNKGNNGAKKGKASRFSKGSGDEKSLNEGGVSSDSIMFSGQDTVFSALVTDRENEGNLSSQAE